MPKIKAGIHHYRIIKDAMREVFNVPNPPLMQGNIRVKDDFYACFYHLAVRGKDGGWTAPGGCGWLNIPDCDGKAFTQINLSGEIAPGNPLKDKQCAVFMEKYGIYQFFGVFKQAGFNDGDRICIFKIISDELDTDTW